MISYDLWTYRECFCKQHQIGMAIRVRAHVPRANLRKLNDASPLMVGDHRSLRLTPSRPCRRPQPSKPISANTTPQGNPPTAGQSSPGTTLACWA